MKYWNCPLKVRRGEHTYEVPHIIEAETHEQALALIKAYSKDWFGEGTDKYDPWRNAWSFDGGCIIVEYGVSGEIDPEKWKQEQWDRALIDKALIDPAIIQTIEEMKQ